MIRTLLSRLSLPVASPLRTAVYHPRLVKTTRTNEPAATCLCSIRSFAKSSTSTAVATPITPTPITSHVRREFEDELHVGRSCSRFRNVTDEQIETWKKQLGTIKPLRLRVPDEYLYPQAKYEMDALAQIHEKSYSCNVMLEIRDVRVPASSHHPSFTRLAAHRVHLICYTHADVIDQETRDRVEAWTLKSWPDSKCIFVDSRESRSFKEKKNEKKTTPEKPKPDQDTDDEEEEKVEKKDDDKELPTSSPFDMVYDSLLHHLETRGGINTALTVGVANTGKSSLLLGLIRTARLRGDLKQNGLKSAATVGKKTKKRRVSKHKGVVEVANKPGKTREITEYMLREKPRTFFMDVPGMTPPTFFFKERPEAWFAFGAANLLPLGGQYEKDVEILSAFCGYVLYAMNRDRNFGYVATLKLEGPTTDLATVLDAVKGPKEGKNPEYTRRKQCFSFLSLFNKGKFGPVILDDLRKPYRRFVFKDKHFVKQKKRHFKDSAGDFSDDEDTNNFDGDDDEDSFYNT